MYDKIEKFGKSKVQHGKMNDRIYLMKLSKSDYPEIIDKLNSLAEEKNYSKIFAKVPEWAVDEFKSDGYRREAYIPKFYEGRTDTYFLSKFVKKSRGVLKEKEKAVIDENINLALSKKGQLQLKKKSSFEPGVLSQEDAAGLAELYSKVFKSYPFPIFEENYLKKTMDENIVYFGIYDDEKLIAASSAEMDTSAKNAEMTDFATDPEYKGNNLSVRLLREMEREMLVRKIKTLYTIARTYSAGMNITFSKMRYKFSGTLVNNTNIAGKIESMNVWYKILV